MEYFRGLLQSGVRIQRFQEAISEQIGPGDTVLEIGTGLGTFAMFAARAGADRVIAVDGDPILHVAKTVAKINDLDSRIEFVRGWVPEIELDCRANVLIFEDYPVRFLDYRTHSMLAAVVERYLTPDARMLPSRGRVWVAPLSDATAWSVCAPLGGANDEAFGIDWSPTREYVSNATLARRVAAETLVCEPQVLYEVPILPLPDARDLAGRLEFTVTESTVVHGLVCWFELGFPGDSWYSNAPGETDSPWGQLILPLQRPVEVETGQNLQVSIHPERGPNGQPGWLCWSFSNGEVSLKGHELKGFAMSEDDFRGERISRK